MNPSERFSMSLGDAIFSLRAIRRVKADPIPEEDLRDMLLAATRAPSGGNGQPWHFLVVRDAKQRRKFGELYREAWWAKRADQGIHGPEDIDASNYTTQSAMRLAEEVGEAPAIVLVCSTEQGVGAMGSVIPAVQNLLLAAAALGINSRLTTIWHFADAELAEILDIPDEYEAMALIPMGYPRDPDHLGGSIRKPISEVTFYDKWGQGK